ncbi:hypothetical protein, partial [Lactobacillus jensenii]
IIFLANAILRLYLLFYRSIIKPLSKIGGCCIIKLKKNISKEDGLITRKCDENEKQFFHKISHQQK